MGCKLGDVVFTTKLLHAFPLPVAEALATFDGKAFVNMMACTNSMFCSRPFVMQIEKGRADAKEQAAEALAKQVAVATFAEISGMIERDLEILRQKLPGKREQAAESALDMKYLRERQANLCSWIELIT